MTGGTYGLGLSITGVEEACEKLGALNGNIQKAARQPMQASIDYVSNRAKAGIAQGPKTGAIYNTYFATSPSGYVYPWGKRPSPHQASARGEYPAADTGNLMRSIWAEIVDKLEATIGSADLNGAELSFNAAQMATTTMTGYIGCDANYAVPLEYKPPELGGRPFMRRALTESKAVILKNFIDGLKGNLV